MQTPKFKFFGFHRNKVWIGPRENIWRVWLNNLKCIFYENWLGSIFHMKRIDLEISRASTGHDVEIDSLDSIIFRRFWINMPYVWLFLNWVAQILVKSCWDDPIRVIVPWRFHWFSEHKYIKLLTTVCMSQLAALSLGQGHWLPWILYSIDRIIWSLYFI